MLKNGSKEFAQAHEAKLDNLGTWAGKHKSNKYLLSLCQKCRIEVVRFPSRIEYSASGDQKIFFQEG